jgi:hypothetical protein
MFEFNTFGRTAAVQLNGANTPETVATFMNYIESGAFDSALFKRLSSDLGTGGTSASELQANVAHGAIILTDGSTESGDTILLKDGTIVDLTPETPSDDSSSIFQIDYTIAPNNQHTNDNTDTLIHDILSLVATYNNSYFGLSAGDEASLKDRLDVLQERIERLENRVNNQVTAISAAAAAGNYQALGEAVDALGNTLNQLGAAQSAAAAGAAVLNK